jgi:hypothetical protein
MMSVEIATEAAQFPGKGIFVAVSPANVTCY